ncbi:hypothetical protein [Pseudomonas cavernicola]|uniref:hypothetical protein n=1 Tax=Pseudomonas cavernicola TaxID=2320866 RepID=UPI001314E89C|nr:hypothetical protein [Pseudomonas cavernicola]
MVDQPGQVEGFDALTGIGPLGLAFPQGGLGEEKGGDCGQDLVVDNGYTLS